MASTREGHGAFRATRTALRSAAFGFGQQLVEAGPPDGGEDGICERRREIIEA